MIYSMRALATLARRTHPLCISPIGIRKLVIFGIGVDLPQRLEALQASRRHTYEVLLFSGNERPNGSFAGRIEPAAHNMVLLCSL